MSTTTVLGQGPDLVLLHGVGVGPDTFVELAQQLASDHRVLLPERLGGPDGAASLEAQAEAVVATLVEHAALGARIVGVSGGATLGLVLALHHRMAIGSLVLHEPLVGRLVPALHGRFVESAHRASLGDGSALEVVRAVLGETTWAELGPVGQAAVATAAPRVRHEVPVFAAFDPTAEQLAALVGLPILTTVGARSLGDRHEVAGVLAAVAGAEVAVLDGSGNAAQLDNPSGFAQLVRHWQPASNGTGA